MFYELKNAAEKAIVDLKDADLYRDFTPMQVSGSKSLPFFTTATGDLVANFCSNDYLGLSVNPAAINAAKGSLEAEGLGAGGSRNIGGTRKIYDELENELADLHGADAALVFNSGYSANFVPMKVVTGPLNGTVFSDTMNHASIIDGLDKAKSGHQKHIFNHNDPDHLDQLLLENAGHEGPAIVVFESVYSMEGDFAPIPDLIEVANRHGASVFLNEVHAVGMLGPEGEGRFGEYRRAGHSVDLIMGTLGKAYGSVGGYIAGEQSIVDAIRSLGRGFIFTTATPPSILAGSLANVRHLRSSDEERFRQAELTAHLTKALKTAQLPIVSEDSHIISVRTGDERQTLAITSWLFEAGYYVTPIRYPTVERGDSRLRITVTPNHNEMLIDSFVEALVHAVTDSNERKQSNVR